MEKDGDRSVHINGPVKNSPVSSGNFHGPVTYNYSENTEARQSNEKKKKTKTKQNQKHQMIRILFLAANPKNTQQLQLNKEYKRIDEELQKSRDRDKFDLQQRQEVSLTELPELLLRFSPQIVHFSGHGSEESALVFQNEDGNSQAAPSAALTKLFEIINRNKKIIQCVVLNACYAERQAEAIAKYVPCVIGMSNAITDVAAIIFAASFYRALGYGRSVNDAFDFGCTDIGLQNLSEEATPRLKYAPGVHPAKVYLTKSR
jgi:CHAT domain